MSTGRLSVPLVRHAVDDPQRPEVCTDGRREHRHYAPSVRRASRNRVHPSTSSVRRHLRRWRRARSVDALPGPRVRKKEQRASLHVQHRVLAAPVFRRVPGGRREDVRAGVRLRGLRAFRMRERRGRQRRAWQRRARQRRARQRRARQRRARQRRARQRRGRQRRARQRRGRLPQWWLRGGLWRRSGLGALGIRMGCESRSHSRAYLLPECSSRSRPLRGSAHGHGRFRDEATFGARAAHKRLHARFCGRTDHSHGDANVSKIDVPIRRAGL